MYLSRFGVKRYKCLGDIDIPLTPIHVLIGENDAGKTSLLEAMAALCNSSDRGIDRCFPRCGDFRQLVRHGVAELSVELWGEWQSISEEALPGFKYGMTVQTAHGGSIGNISCEWLVRSGERTRRHITSSGNITGLCVVTRGIAADRQLIDDFRGIAGTVAVAHKYAMDAKLMATPAAVDRKRTFRLDSDGFGLPTLLQDIVNYEPEKFIELRDEFCRFFPQFTCIRLEVDDAVKRQYSPGTVSGASTTDGVAIYLETRTGDWIRAQEASDGAILFLAYVALAHLPKPPGLLLIEEPENGIYPKRLGEVIQMLKEMVNRSDGVVFPQIILSTHSPYVLSFFEPEEVTFLSRPADDPNGPVRARPLREAPNIEERLAGGDFYLGELWYNLSEQDLFGEH